MNDRPPKRYWFPAKRYGYGWGLPCTWEGWVVFIGYLAAVFGGMALFPPDRMLAFYMAYFIGLTVLFCLVCWLTGEPPRWRWGDEAGGGASGRPAGRPEPGKRELLVLHLLFGPLILGMAVFFRVHPPAEINHTYGYRTATSMQSQEEWDEAQRYSANVMIVAGLVIVLYQVLSSLTMRPVVSLITTTVVLLLTILAVVPITEAHLKSMFNDQGQRIGAER